MATRRTLKVVAPESSEETIEDLEEIERAQERSQERPSSLPLQEIHVAQQAFQWRLENDNLLADTNHIRELARVIRDQSKPLKEILVTAIGSKFYAVDGHHRLAAYLTVGWKKRVPVEVFNGSAREAWTEALARNAQDKLPMTREAKYEAAWKLNQVKTPDGKYRYSKAQIMKMTTASDGLIANMRRVLETHGDEVTGMTWREVKNRQWKQQGQNYEHEVWVDEKAREIAEKLIASTKVRFIQKPEVLARAIEMISPALSEALIMEWYDEACVIIDEHREYVREEEEERKASGLDI